MRKKTIFREVRFSIYIALLVCGIILWKAAIVFKCNISNKQCFACGLRTAVDLFLKGQFINAYLANKFVLAIVLFAVVMTLDFAIYAYRKVIKLI